MILTCTNCKTSFVTTESLIGTSGRKVKCSKCQNIWFATLPPKTKIDPILTQSPIQDLQGSFNLPTNVSINIPWYLYVFPVILFSIIIVLYMLLFPTKSLDLGLINSKILCEKYNFCDSQNLQLKDVKFEKVHENNKNLAILSYKITNPTDKAKALPCIKIKLLDKNFKVTKTHITESKRVELKPLHQRLVETRFEDLPPEITKIELSIGNRLELYLR